MCLHCFPQESVTQQLRNAEDLKLRVTAASYEQLVADLGLDAVAITEWRSAEQR